jgi:tetratricopeptide (TPR) repeat protein
MGIAEELAHAAGRALEDADRSGAFRTPDGCVAMRSAIDLILQLARHRLEEGDVDRARDDAASALTLLDRLDESAGALPGVPGLRLDAHQIIGTFLLEQGDTEAAVEELRRAASHVYGAQPDERVVSVACPPLERQLAELWRALAPSPAAHRVRASLRAVRTMLGHLDEAVHVETGALRDVRSAHVGGVDGTFYDTASVLVERPLRPGSDATSRLERARAAAAAPTGDAERDARARLALAEALRRVGRTSEAVEMLGPLLDVVADLPATTAVEVCLGASTVALLGLRTDLGLQFGVIARDVALRTAAEGGRVNPALEGVARFTLGRALSEADDDEAALIECEAAHRLLAATTEIAPTPVRSAAAYAAAYLAFLRENSEDRAGAAAALAAAQEVAAQLATERHDDDGVLAVVLEVSMATARRLVHEGPAHFAAAIDLLETAFARDPDDLAIAIDLYNALRFFAVMLIGTRDDEVVAAQRRSMELSERIRAADPEGLYVAFQRAQLAQELALAAHRDGRQSTFRWLAQDSMKLHAACVALAPQLPASTARSAKAALQLAQVAAGMRDRKLARRLVDDGLRSARRQVELQPDVLTAHEDLVVRIRVAATIVAMTGDGRRQRELTLEALDAARALVALDPDDPERQYALIDALTESVAVVGEGRMKGVDHLFEELERLVEHARALDPLHPRLMRAVFSVAEASALRAHAEDRHEDAARHAVAALRGAHGGMHIRHHHGGTDHSRPEERHRVEVLSAMLRALLADEQVVIGDAERDEATSLLARLHRSGLGPDPTASGSGAGAAGALPEPEDDIREVLAPLPDGVPDVGEVLVGGRRDGTSVGSTFIKPSNGGHPGLLFGVGLAATEDLVVIGAPGDPSAEHHVLVDGDASDRSADSRGAVHVHRRSADGWHHEAYLKPPLPAHGLKFGWSVAVDGERIAVGSPTATYPNDQEDLLPGERRPRLGGVWVFEHDDGWRLADVLIPDDDTPTLELGERLALQGDTLLASGKDAESGHGIVIEFVRDGEEWMQRSVLRSPRPQFSGREGLLFGHSLALDGDVLVVGEPTFFGPVRARSDDPKDDLLCGAAWVFRRDRAGDWGVEAMLLGPAPRFGSAHGMAVDVRGDLIAVSASLHPNRKDDEGPGPARAGAVALYGCSATGWEGLATLIPPHPHSQEFGGRVAIGDDREIAIGVSLDAHGTDWSAAPEVAGGSGPRYGAVHVIAETAEGWRFTRVVVAEHPGAGDEFGSRIAWSGRDLVVAAPNDSSSGVGVGAVLHDDDARDSGAVHVVTGLRAGEVRDRG